MSALYAIVEAGGEPQELVLSVSGEVDTTNAERFEEDVLARAGGTGGRVVLDLVGAEYFDSAGLAVLDRLVSRGVALVVPPGCLIRKAAVLMALPLYEDLPGARSAGGGG